MKYKEAHFLEPVPVLAVSLDIGWSTSGYAFSFKGSENIQTGEYGGMLPKSKVPTVLLLNPDQQFNSFGDDAIDAYERLPEESRQQYYFIKAFAKKLSVLKQVSESTCFQDISNKQVNALLVYTLTLRYLKTIALLAARENVIGLKVDYTLWIIPVPDHCSDSVRHFLHEAATRAGIPKDRLRLVSECESLVLFWQENSCVSLNQNVCKLKIGERFILVEISEYIQIVVCKNIKESTCKLLETVTTKGEVKSALQEMLQFFIDLVGEDVWKVFEEKHVSCYTNMLREITNKIMSFTQNSEIIHIIPEYSLLSILRKQGKHLDHLVEGSDFSRFVLYDEDSNRIFIKRRLIEAFFLPTVNLLKFKLYEVLKSSVGQTVRNIVVYGSQSECPYVKETLKMEFRDLGLIVLPDGESAVGRGAVMMGLMQRGVQGRIARFSYGIPAAMPFVGGEHPEKMKKTCDGEDWCENIFMRIIERGQVVTCGDTFILNFYSTSLDQRLKHCPIDTLFMLSKLKSPKFCTKGEGCSLLGKITMNPPAAGWPKICKGEIRLLVKQSGFVLEIINKTTGQIRGATMEFM